ncbi:MAG: phosphatase PAP2 family protein [Nitrososphaerales archaeon]
MLSTRDAVIELRSGTFVLLIIILVAISVLVASGITAEFDEPIIRAIVDARGIPSVDALMLVITSLTDLFIIVPFSLILLIKRKTRRLGAILLMALVLSTLASTYLKQIVDRERPQYEFQPSIDLGYKPEQDVISRSASSFPSGHATRSAAFALIISYMIRDRFLAGIPAGIMMWAFPASVAFSRIYIGAHYPTDVIAGVVLGIIIANGLGRILKFEATVQQSQT